MAENIGLAARDSVFVRDAGDPEAWHRDHGVLVMNGPGLRSDELIHGAGLLDLTPTILSMYGLPVGPDNRVGPMLRASWKRARAWH